jgi:hypothetical protein
MDLTDSAVLLRPAGVILAHERRLSRETQPEQYRAVEQGGSALADAGPPLITGGPGG